MGGSDELSLLIAIGDKMAHKLLYFGQIAPKKFNRLKIFEGFMCMKNDPLLQFWRCVDGVSPKQP